MENKYRYWDILEELPEGWVIDKTAGSPAPNTLFITNGKSAISGKQKRALLKIKIKKDINTPKNEMLSDCIIDNKEVLDKTETIIFPAKTVNDLARLKFKEQILKEIMFDLMVCEIEKWDKKEYINEIKKLLNKINISNKKKKNITMLPDLFTSVNI
jgi:HD superfamily phosphodiesterase